MPTEKWHFPGKFTLRKQLTGLTLLTGMIAAGLTAAGLTAYEVVWFQQQLTSSSRSIADILGSNISAALAFEADYEVTRSLAALKEERWIVRASVFDAKGTFIAGYTRTDETGRHRNPRSPKEAMEESSGPVVLRQVLLDHEVVGYIALEWDLSILHERVMVYSSITILFALLSLAIAYAASRRVQAWISAPLLRLEAAARQVTAQRDYSVRVESRNGDELGAVMAAFNGMLHEIQVRDQRLQDSAENLESEVAARTHALTEANARLSIAKEKAEAAAKAKGEFLATMSHEVRTPMNAVIGFTQLLEGTELTVQQRDWVETVRRSGEGLLRILNDILDFSRADAGKLELEQIPFVPEEVAEEAIELVSESARQKGLRIIFHSSPAVPLLVRGDPGRLRQVLLNLLSNAVKFTESGEVQLNVDLVENKGDVSIVRIEVVDTGPGIPIPAQESIFDAFTQADSSTTRRFGGTGLGLAICRRLVSAMGGEIGVISQQGRGSTFWFKVPLIRMQTHRDKEAVGCMRPAIVVEADQARATATPNVPREPEATRNSDDLAILVAEDNLINQKVLKSQLSRLGYSAEFVRNGREALEAAVARPFDVILMDCQMPEMDGFEAARRIRERENGTRRTEIVAVTANAMPSDRENCLAAGMDGYLSKPVDCTELALALKTVRASIRR